MDGDASKKSVDSAGSEPAIKLSQMPQRIEVRDPEDDWTGLNSPKERRRLQNRLNQRLWRKRQRVQKLKRGGASESNNLASESMIPSILGDYSTEIELAGKKLVLDSAVEPAGPPHLSKSLCKMKPAEMQEMVSRFETWAHKNYLLGSPRVDLLLTLVQFNVFRALISNTFSLGFDLAWLNEDAISPFNTTNFDASSLPESLRPTQLQRTVPHHPWIDLFPLPAMRDNLLLEGEDYDDTEICQDVVEIGGKAKEQAGLIVWGEPWNPYAWEASPEFLQKWAWVVADCHTLLESTNYWRMKRGEKKIAFPYPTQERIASLDSKEE